MKIKRFPLGALWTNCYVVWDADKNGFAVDPGGPAGEVADFIKKEGVKLRLVILTHGHCDHIGGVPDLRAASENGVAIHEEDAECLTAPGENLSQYFGGSAIEMPKADRLLKDGDRIEIGRMTLDVIHTPGHTRGGICIVVTDGAERILLSGDTLFARSIGRSDMPGGDEKTLINSLKKLEALPDNINVFPGHGPDTTIGAEKRYNPYWPRD